MRRKPATAVVAAVLAMASLALGTAPVLADGFTVGILLDPNETRSAAFMKGFQLAVDQSPDVSHPPNVEGGDHLGSMDVRMAVRDGDKELDEFISAAMRLIERRGVPIIVADVSPATLAALVEPVADAKTMLIAMGEADSAELADNVEPGAAPFFFSAARVGTEALLIDREPPFEEAFMAAYGRQPSDAATRGYVAGRLVDIGVEATDRDPFDQETLAAALVAATTSLLVEQSGEPAKSFDPRAQPIGRRLIQGPGTPSQGLSGPASALVRRFSGSTRSLVLGEHAVRRRVIRVV